MLRPAVLVGIDLGTLRLPALIDAAPALSPRIYMSLAVNRWLRAARKVVVRAENNLRLLGSMGDVVARLSGGEAHLGLPRR